MKVSVQKFTYLQLWFVLDEFSNYVKKLLILKPREKNQKNEIVIVYKSICIQQITIFPPIFSISRFSSEM